MNLLNPGVGFSDPDTLKYAHEIDSVSVMRTAGPMMLALIFLEALFGFFRRSKVARLNDSINSISHGSLERIWSSLTTKTFEFGFYCYIYAHWAPIKFEESPLLGLITFLGVDLGYYWFHRMAHEINLFWAAHSVHHSSEEYNFSTAMRQSALQFYCSWMFYLPLAFFVPPRLFYFHQQVNLIYQFWIHTKLVGKTPLLDLVLNTPSLHRVHHGRNPLYLDKNYGGILIIWDRLFGTFQAETEEPAFGLVHPSQSFNLFRGQLAHLQYMCGRIMEEKGLWNKWAVIWKGPGWREGAPRLGFASDIPDLDPTHRKYDPALSASLNYYIALNFFAVSLLSVFFTFNMIPLTPGHLIFLALFVFGLQSFSVMFDKEFYACYMELARTSAFVICDLYCYMTSGSEGHNYLFLWYEDPTGYFSSTSLGFVLLRLIWAGSFLFMLFHIMSSTGMLIPKEKKVDNKVQVLDPAGELLKGSRPSGLSSPKPLSPATNGSPSSRTHSRKPRSLQVGVALLETL